MPVIKVRRHSKLGYVVPGCTIAKRGSSVTFVNATSGPVRIQFFNNKLFRRDGIGLPGPSKGRSLPSLRLAVNSKAPCGLYPYAVFCHAGPQFAVGHSMPIIIKP